MPKTTNTDEPTKAELRKARSEIRKALVLLMRDSKKHAMASLDKAIQNGADVLRDHIADGSPMRIPKDFLCAVLRDLQGPRGYGPSAIYSPGGGFRKDRKTERRIEHYRYHI